MVRVHVGGLTLDGTDGPATYTISEDGLTGWWAGVATRLPTIERPQQHGEFPKDGLLGARTITVEGVIHTEDGLDQAERMNALSSVLAGGEGGLLTVEEPAGVKWAMVRRVGEPDVRILVYGKTAVYQVRFRAADPRRYSTGEWVETGPPSAGQGVVWPVVWTAVWPGGGSSGRVLLPNDGKAPSSPSFVLSGGFSSALVTCVETGARFGFERPIPAGQSVVIEKGRATLGGQDVSRWLRFREWTSIPGGFSRTFQFDVTDPVGSPMMAGKVDHAWW
ncbi:phage tail family protein [Microbacterium sp. 5K110]|jgi:hypothetical protein|uniref:phage tail family protein n=1 Tax=Microbacterium sp. 5K110 TaxID=2578104 RepID=UPI0010FE91EB|nr:phage tail family protein [Microbacterium sp. 5K110]TLF33226.1 hypothetical protein FE256_03785 [Microbacterium sp. 5K110]